MTLALLTVVAANARFEQRASPADPGSLPAAPSTVDPVLAARLAEKAHEVAGHDPLAAIRFLLAAHTVDPISTAHRAALTEALLGPSHHVSPTLTHETALGSDPPVAAVMTTDGSFLVLTSRQRTQVLLTKWIGPPQVTVAKTFDKPVTATAGADTPSGTTLVIDDGTGTATYGAAYPGIVQRLGALGPHADAVAVAPDGTTAAVVTDTTATLWNVDMLARKQVATLSYDQPVTTLRFTPGPSSTLVAGHADGSLTLHSISIARDNATKKHLAGGPAGSINAATANSRGTRAVAITANGDLTIWDLTATATQPAGSLPNAVEPGPHTVWLDPTGTFAITTGQRDIALWNLIDPTAPRPINRSLLPPGHTIPAMVNDQGTKAITVRQDIFQIWNLEPVQQVLAEPTHQACRTAPVNETQWRDMVPDTRWANPCPTNTPPKID